MLRYSEASGSFARAGQMLRCTCSENVFGDRRKPLPNRRLQKSASERITFMLRGCGVAAWPLSMTVFGKSGFCKSSNRCGGLSAFVNQQRPQLSYYLHQLV